MFDVIRFLDDHGIPWWPPGENVSQGHVGVTCPFCDDNYNHLGLDMKGKRRPYCWKCGGHGWYDFVKVKTGKSFKKIQSEYGQIYSHQIETEPDIPRGGATVCVPPGTKDFKPTHKKYLTVRGFDAEYTVRKFGLQVTGATGKLPYRIIIPIFLKGKVVSYQGRTYADQKPKYLTCKPEEEVVFHKDTLYNIDSVRGKTGIVVEGAFDAMKLGDNAVATFGTSLSKSQLNLLAYHFDRVFFIFDPEEGAQGIAEKSARTLSTMGTTVEQIELEEGDPGDLSVDDALHLKSELGVI